MNSRYYLNLINTVIEYSNSDYWEDAVNEWYIIDCEEDETLESSCICGKENLRYLFTIKNEFNGNELYPIGSSCIKKFGREEMYEEAYIHEELFKLLHAIEQNDYISLSSDYFSRKLLLFLYNEGVFDTTYNHFDGEQDYLFMLKMFNKRDKTSITRLQDKKIKAIIVNSVIPYLRRKLRFQ